MSIFAKAVILLSISLALMGFLSFKTNQIQNAKAQLFYKEKYIQSANDLIALLINADSKNLQNRLKILEFTRSNLPENLKDYKEIYSEKITFGHVKLYENSGLYYLNLSYLDENLFLFDTTQMLGAREKTTLNLLIYADIFLLFVTFLIFIKILTPIKKLANTIEKFGKGNYSYRLKPTKSNDEIAQVIDKFNQMASDIEAMDKARIQLLTDISHELRTPISKSKIAISFLEDSKYKTILQNAVSSMDKLTDELMHIERLNSQNANFKLETLNIQTVLLQSLSQMLVFDENIEIDARDNFSFQADPNYICIAIKNLIDNALKYNDFTKSDKIFIVAKNHKLYVKNHALKLEQPLSYYTDKFTKTNELSGYGYGLSLVKRILDKHKFKLTYTYQNAQNVFCVDFSS
ncbi:two-component system sensor histidine kinase [Campylobacter iguaniorum]|uniref:histidine kinase n=1 Tax=Campylobacter iguaniorum TaxID=1244531 RepID=A0A076F881_9BACT|nr:HAMP domain-containing protein [Campylobacter iguaniorum]AII14420.1 two-component system sensor histidine kinase [Campylobacter iguaniorum]ALV24155.1 two-component system sensor histidine kinase [Campylobacter iguaniorum]